MTPRPAHWAGTTIRSHRVPAGGEHRATSRRSPSRAIPYALAGAAAAFLAVSMVIGFHLPTGAVPAWERERPPAGKLFPLVPQTSTPTDPAATEDGGEPADRASRSGGSRPTNLAPTDSTPVPDVPRPPEAAPSAAAAPQPLATVMPTPGCPPPLPEPAKKPKVTHPPRGPKVQLAPTPSPQQPSRGES